MASRTKLIGLQYYDRDGGLDYYIWGSQWSDWYDDSLKRSPYNLSVTKKILKRKLMEKFEMAVDRALDMDPQEIRKEG